ncbi:hypothetical protein SteCoe_38646 [Stentor coeruleus]|uniref:Uncharacterized protein n=1 Tax=Stentor coeruleus TaxID=5963 RepID=A0A1R2AL64_9CILI|nr:hypothetical protein SteCoe_38646 [Stentor coeruleus]
MSIESLPKQLPSMHILERRFSPYKKANYFIKHFEKQLLSKIQSSQNKDPIFIHNKYKYLLPEPETVKKSYTPAAKLSREIQQKIEIINTFNNLSELKPVKKKSKRVKSNQLQTIPKLEVIIAKTKYFQLVNEAFNDNDKKNISLSRKVHHDLPRIKRSICIKKKLRDEVFGKVIYDQGEDKRDFIIGLELKTPESFFMSRHEEGPIIRARSTTLYRKGNKDKDYKGDNESVTRNIRSKGKKYSEDIMDLLYISSVKNSRGV